MRQIGIIFRVDAGRIEGLGHLQRCIALATYLKNQGCNVWFICRARVATTNQRLKDFPVFYLENIKKIDGLSCGEEWDARATLHTIENQAITPSLIVVDHYALGAKWESKLRAAGYGIVVIDDFRTRHHQADLITSDSIAPFDLSLNGGLTDAIFLNGPLYTLLSPDYALADLREITKVNRILITYGGADPTGETLKAINAIGSLISQGRLSKNINVDVVIGPLNELDAPLSKAAEEFGLTIYYSPLKLTTLMLAADLILTSGGNSMVEALALLKPCIVTVTAENQWQMVSELKALGVINLIGESHGVSVSILAEAVVETVQSVEIWGMKISEIRPFDCFGAQRIGQSILGLSGQI